MIGGTTASDLATCELKVMKQRSNSNSKHKSNPNPKGKGFLIKGEGEGVWGARWRSSPAGSISALREGLDTAVVVIDADDLRMGFEQAHDFAFDVTVATPQPFPGLRHHLLHQRQRVPQLPHLDFDLQRLADHFQLTLFPSCHHSVALAHHLACDRQQFPV